MSTSITQQYSIARVLHNLEEKNKNDLHRDLETMIEINKSHATEVVNAILEDYTDNVQSYLKVDHRIQNQIYSFFESPRDQLVLQLGFFNGMHRFAQLLLRTKENKERDDALLRRFLGRKHTEDIFSYLYYHPSARHKDLAEALTVSASGLSDILKDLVREDVVRKTEQSKYSYYSLSYPAYAFTKKNLIARKPSAKKTVYMSCYAKPHGSSFYNFTEVEQPESQSRPWAFVYLEGRNARITEGESK